MIEAQVNERQLREANARLERFAAAMADPTPANRQASIAIYGWTLRNFDRQGAMGAPWAPLHPKTVKQKQKIGKEQMLVRTGQLRANFTQDYSRDNAVVGNAIPYSKFHHEGTRRLPKRELLPQRQIVLDIGLKVYGAYVAREARKANG